MTEKEKNNESSGFTEDANALTKAKRRPIWKTIIVRMFQAVGLLVLFIIGYCILITFAKPHITVDYVEKMNELSRLSTDESLNAAHDYKKAFEAYKPDPNLGKLRDEKQNIKDFNEAELAAVRKWIADNNTAIDYYLKAAQKPYCWWDGKLKDPNNILFSIVMPDLGPNRKLIILILFNSKLDAHDGNLGTAFDKICASFKSAIHRKGSRILVDQLVGIGIQGICNGTALNILRNEKIGSDQLERLQAELEAIMAKDDCKVYFDTERFLLYDCLQKFYTDESLFGGRLIPSKASIYLLDRNSRINLALGYGLSIISASRAEIRRFANEIYDKCDELSLLTPYKGREKIKELGRERGSLTGIKGIRYLLPSLLMPAFEKTISISYRSKILNEATICIIALHRYKLDKGFYPDTLEQLVQAGYIKSIPMDPFSDKQIVYRKTGDEFIVYSAGLNFIDDGGIAGKDNNGKFRQWADNGDNIFWPVQ